MHAAEDQTLDAWSSAVGGVPDAVPTPSGSSQTNEADRGQLLGEHGRKHRVVSRDHRTPGKIQRWLGESTSTHRIGTAATGSTEVGSVAVGACVALDQTGRRLAFRRRRNTGIVGNVAQSVTWAMINPVESRTPSANVTFMPSETISSYTLATKRGLVLSNSATAPFYGPIRVHEALQESQTLTQLARR